MPYEGEYATYAPLHRVAAGKRVQEQLQRYAVRTRNPQLAPPPFHFIDELPYEGWQPDYVIALDGNATAVSLETGYPGAEAAYITTAAVLLKMQLIRDLSRRRPVDPQLVRQTEQADAVDCALPGTNVIFGSEASAEASFRRAYLEVLASSRLQGAHESLLDTYEALLALKPTGREPDCPYEDCLRPDKTYQRGSGQYACSRLHHRNLYSTDALRLTERMNHGGSNLEMYGEALQVLERLWVIHILRAFVDNNWTVLLGRIAFIVDGPLALFSHPAWLAAAIEQELQRLNGIVRQQTGQDILLLGIQKTGVFSTHFQHLDQDRPGEGELIPPGSYLLLTNGYIRDHILPSESTKPWGVDTYFGRPFFYKTRRRSLIVGNLPFLESAHRNTSVALPGQFPRLVDALHLLDQLVSNRYENAVSALVAANAAAAIPLRMGTRVLENLARDLMQAAGL
jgi:hypothetical protein